MLTASDMIICGISANERPIYPSLYNEQYLQTLLYFFKIL